MSDRGEGADICARYGADFQVVKMLVSMNFLVSRSAGGLIPDDTCVGVSNNHQESVRQSARDMRRVGPESVTR